MDSTTIWTLPNGLAIPAARSLAGAPGFEPGNGGIKIRCLTTWLRPKARAEHTGSTRAGQVARLAAAGSAKQPAHGMSGCGSPNPLLEHEEPRNRDDGCDPDDRRGHLQAEAVGPAVAMMLALHCHWTSPSRGWPTSW